MKLTKKERTDLARLSAHVRNVLLRQFDGSPLPSAHLAAWLQRSLDLVDRLADSEAKR
jgi:hypothetical protein